MLRRFGQNRSSETDDAQVPSSPILVEDNAFTPPFFLKFLADPFLPTMEEANLSMIKPSLRSESSEAALPSTTMEDDSPLREADNLLQQVLCLYNTGYYEEAEKLLDDTILKIKFLSLHNDSETLKIKETLVFLLETRAKRLEILEDFKACYSDREYIYTLFSTDTNKRKVFLIEAKLHEKEGNYLAAIAAYENATNLYPHYHEDSEMNFYSCVRLYRKMGAQNPGKAAYERATFLRHPLPIAATVQQENSCHAHQEYTRKNYSNAKRHYQIIINSIKASEDFFSILYFCYFQIGIILYHSKRYEHALDFFKKTSLNPEVLEKTQLKLVRHKEKANQLYHQGQYLLSLEWHEEIVKSIYLNTGDFSIFSESHLYLGIIKKDTKKEYLEALIHFKKSYVLGYNPEYLIILMIPLLSEYYSILIKDLKVVKSNIKFYLVLINNEIINSLKDIPNINPSISQILNTLDDMLMAHILNPFYVPVPSPQYRRIMPS